MEEEKDFINELYEKLDTVEDLELKKMVLKLIEERNNLINEARIDPLSGLYNRRILPSIRNYELVAMLDLDNFKTINDTFGHDAGDMVIKTVSSIIKKNSRSSDFVIRYGGDEFVVVFTGGNIDIIKERMQKISEEVSQSINLPDFTVTLSIGVSRYEREVSLDDLIKEADDTMYVSKTSGKDRISVSEDIPQENQQIRR